MLEVDIINKPPTICKVHPQGNLSLRVLGMIKLECHFVDEKHKILGVCFDPEFYNETGEITPQNANYDAMIQRLNEMNISFETEELGGNSIRRFQAIMNSNPSNTTEITSFQKPNADVDKWTRLMLDSRELSLSNCSRDMQKNSKLYVSACCAC